ncbi:diaminopimelate decarboxylase [Limnospira platensis C1]|nr:diaminopimelate decarboxylase [Arthrospira platensis C1]
MVRSQIHAPIKKLTIDTKTVENSGLQYLLNSEESTTERSPNQQLLPLTAKVNHQDHLEIGGCDVAEMVSQFGSPLYILDEVTLRTACRQYREAWAKYYPGESLILYASKAWNCLAICAIVASEGLGTDVVSGGELYTAKTAGVSPDKIYLHGNNKSRSELELAISTGCTVVADNWLDLTNLVELADEMSVQSPVRVMIRFTPGIECHTHEYIRTGHLDSKFGFDPNQLDEVFKFVSSNPSLCCEGIHAHIGSQIFELQPHQDLAGVLMDAVTKGSQYGLNITEVNVGGGLGIRYTEDDDPPSIESWVSAIASSVVAACEQRQIPLPKLLCEPGRSIIGPAAITAYTIGSRKEIPDLRTYIAVDGGMSDNPRPITYQSVYRVVIANRMSAPLTETITVAGKHCESGDILIQQAHLPGDCQTGDILVVMATGAYNYSMASNYNRLPRPAAVLVNDSLSSIIIQRETYSDLIRQDRLPERLGDRP